MNELHANMPSHLMRESEIGTPKPKNGMGKDDFMKLLLAQLQNQDPLKPTPNQEFVAQLAQFSSLEQLSNIDKGVQGLKGGLSEDSKYHALNMIGKHVMASGNELDLKEGQSAAIPVRLENNMKAVKAVVADMNGKLVREMDLSSVSSSQMAQLEWDGKDNQGVAAVGGKYRFEVLAMDGQGRMQPMGSQVKGRVISVELRGNDPTLTVETKDGIKTVSFSRISEIGEQAKGGENAGGPVLISNGVANAELQANEDASEGEGFERPIGGRISSFGGGRF